MEIRVINDIHWEHSPFQIEKTEMDRETVLVISGDLAIPEFQKEALESICPGFRHVLYVPGNHEYENEDIAQYSIQNRFGYIENLTVLTGTVKVIGSVAFAGTTLWTDFLNQNWFCMHNAKDNVSDYEFIKHNGRRFCPQDALERHYLEKERLEVILANLREMKRVGNISSFNVITHHAPSRKSMDPNFKLPLMLEGIFYSDLENLVGYSEADYWFHGHIHSSCDYSLGDTQVICNPRGNGNWLNPKFDQNFIVEVPSWD